MNWARIEAVFAAADGRTRAAVLRGAAPLKIAKTFALPQGALGVCIMDASPGMLAGDCYVLDFTLQAHARVAVTTQGFTRVHPARGYNGERSSEHTGERDGDAGGCELEARLEVGAGAHLEWWPEPLMLYAGADLRARTTVKLASGATFVARDIWCAGRGGRGENWEFARLGNRWNIERAGVPIFASALDVEPRKRDPRARAAWDSWTHTGSFLVFGAHADAALCEGFWQIIEGQNAVYAGASVIESGVIVSMLGARAHDLQELSRALRDRARETEGASKKARAEFAVNP